MTAIPDDVVRNALSDVMGHSTVSDSCTAAKRTVGSRPTADVSHKNQNGTIHRIVSDCKKAMTLALLSADASPPYGFMLLPGTISSGFAMKRSSFASFQTKSAPFIALE